jgi:hypothetical protein
MGDFIPDPPAVGSKDVRSLLPAPSTANGGAVALPTSPKSTKDKIQLPATVPNFLAKLWALVEGMAVQCDVQPLC